MFPRLIHLGCFAAGLAACAHDARLVEAAGALRVDPGVLDVDGRRTPCALHPVRLEGRGVVIGSSWRPVSGDFDDVLAPELDWLEVDGERAIELDICPDAWPFSGLFELQLRSAPSVAIWIEGELP